MSKDKTASQEIKIKTDAGMIEGTLAIPADAIGIVVFAHGSGSSRLSPRNTFVARELQKASLATLLIDLLTEKEDEVYETRFDIELLTNRLVHIVKWVHDDKRTSNLAICLFGASTGAAAALQAAARLGPLVKAVVSRGGRPDLAMDELAAVASPTLLIVGGYDEEVIELNREAYDKLRCTKRMEIIAGATHLFEEPGTLEQVAEHTGQWFVHQLRHPTNAE